MSCLYKFVIASILLLTITGCFDTNVQVMAVDSSTYYPELEGTYVSGDPEDIDDQDFYYEEDDISQIVYSREDRHYLFRKGQETFIFDAKKVSPDLYLTQLVNPEPSNEETEGDISNLISFLRRVPGGHLVDVMPEDEQIVASMEKMDLDYEYRWGMLEIKGTNENLIKSYIDTLSEQKLVATEIAFINLSKTGKVESN